MANEKVISLEVGQLQANCYIVFAENSTPAFVIDPGADAPRIAAVLRENSLECCMIVLTHGHYDHIGGVNELLSFFPDARLAVHKDEAEMLSQPTLNLSWFFNEAVRLRESGVEAPILVLGYTPAWLAREALLHDVTLTLYDADMARAFSRAAAGLRRTARVHIKVDTGMGRLGLLPEQVVPFVQEVAGLPHLDMEGIFTHFSVADNQNLDYTYSQLDRFRAVLDQLAEIGTTFRLVHCANSAATLRLPDARFNMVRLGLVMYGLQPSPHVQLPPGFRPALSWKTTIAQVKTLPPGSYVGYGNTYRTTRRETIAVIPVGYADGFRRAPTHWHEVLVHGQRAPIVGRVCMDQAMIKVDHIPNVRVGDEVVLIGQQKDDQITAEEAAAWLGTINYEVVSEILARVPRMM